MFDYKAVTAPLEQNLADIATFMWQQGIPNRISEDVDAQVIWVGNQAHIASAQAIYEDFTSGKLVLQRVDAPHAKTSQSSLPPSSQWPWLTLLLILGSGIGALLVMLEVNVLRHLFFQPVDFIANRTIFKPVASALNQGEYWRLLTPIFIHFGLMHVVFNSLWMWEFGRKIEYRQGRIHYAAIVLLMGIGSNIAQYLWHPNVLFGGMSGVVYGVLAYCWICGKLRPSMGLAVRDSIAIFMLVWLVLGMLDALAPLGILFGNAAHLSGLILGLLLGLGACYIAPKSHKV